MYIWIYWILSLSFLLRWLFLWNTWVAILWWVNLLFSFLFLRTTKDWEKIITNGEYQIWSIFLSLKQKIIDHSDAFNSFHHRVLTPWVKKMVLNVVYRYLVPLSLFWTIWTLLFVVDWSSWWWKIMLPFSVFLILFWFVSDRIESLGFVIGNLTMTWYERWAVVWMFVSTYFFMSSFTYGTLSSFSLFLSLVFWWLCYAFIVSISTKNNSFQSMYRHLLSRLWFGSIVCSLVIWWIFRWIERVDDHTIEKIVYKEKEVPIYIEREPEWANGGKVNQKSFWSAPKDEENEWTIWNWTDIIEDLSWEEKLLIDLDEKEKNKKWSEDNLWEWVKSLRESKDTFLDDQLDIYDDSIWKKFINLATEELIKE